MATHPFGLNGPPNVNHSRIRGGHWYRVGNPAVINSLPLANNFMVLVPFWPAYRGTIDGVAYELVTAAVHASGTETFRIGLYADDGQGRPTGAALFQTANIDMETVGTGAHAVAVSWTGIKPQLYWLAITRRQGGTVGTNGALRLGSFDDFRDCIVGDEGATPQIMTVSGPAFNAWCNYEMAIVADALPTIASLAHGTFIQSPMLMVKFT